MPKIKKDPALGGGSVAGYFGSIPGIFLLQSRAHAESLVQLTAPQRQNGPLATLTKDCFKLFHILVGPVCTWQPE